MSNRTITELYQALRPLLLRDFGAAAGGSSGAGGGLAAHDLNGAYHTGSLAESQAPWAATKLEWATALATHAALADVHHAQRHALVGADHAASGLTAGWTVRASGETTFGWAQLQHGDLGDVTADQHHNQVHDIVGGDHTAIGSRWQIVGLTDNNDLGLITPIISTLATPEGILKSDGAGGVYLRQLGIGTNSPARKLHILDNTGAQMRLSYDEANYMDFLVDAGGSWRIAPTGDIIVDPQSDDMRPLNNYDVNLGLPIKKFLSIHAAEAWFDTLVASEVRSTIGGKVWVAPTTELTRDLAGSTTTIDTITQRGATQVASGSGASGGLNTIAQRGSVVVNSAYTASLSVNRPTGVVNGDLLVAVVAYWEGTLTPPAGWTQEGATLSWSHPDGTIYARVYRRVASSEPSSYTWGLSIANDMSCAITAYSGVDTGNPISAIGGQTQNSASMTAPTVNAATTADMLLFLGAIADTDSGVVTATQPGGMTELSDAINGLWIKTYVAQQNLIASGATGTRTAALSASARNAAFTVALRPAATPPANASVTVSPPAGVATGDVMLAVVAYNSGALTPAAGWTNILSQAGTGATLAVYRRTAGASEVSSVWSLNTTGALSVAVSAYDNVDATMPIDVFGVQANASSTAMTAPSITPVAGADMLVFAGAVAANVRATAPAGMAEDADAGATGVGVYMADQLLVASGATGTRIATLASATENIAALIALQPSVTAGGSAPTTIYVKYNNLSTGDRVFMEARGRFEALGVTSNYTTITAGAEYSYTVTRDLDGTGANDWIAGDALVNTGQTGLGWIELYAQYGFPRAGQIATQRVGPTIVGNVRKSATFNDFREHWAIGNLNGLYDFSGNQYGAAFGDPTQTWLSLDDRAAGLGGGLRFMNNLAEVGYIRNNGQWRFNGDANNYIAWDGSSLKVRGDIVVTGAVDWTNVAGGINLVRNSSFELDSNSDGLADGFTIYNNDGGAVPATASRVAGSKSTWAQRVSWAGTNASTKGIFFDITYPKRWEVDYVLTFWARTNTPVNLGWYENPPGATVTYLQWPQADTTWKFYAVRLQWTPGGGYGAPGQYFYISIQSGAAIANGWIEFDNVQVVEGSQIVPYGASPIDIVGFGGKINMNLAYQGAGLYLSSQLLGYFNGTAWTAYMNNAGQFGLNAGGSNYLAWDGSTLTVAGSINVVGGNAATQTYAANQASAAQSAAQTYASGVAATAQSNAQTYAAGQASIAQSNAYGYTDVMAALKANTSLNNSAISTLINGANIRVGAGTKDANLYGWNIDINEIVGQTNGADQVVLDGTGKIVAGAGATVMDAAGISLQSGTSTTGRQLSWYDNPASRGNKRAYIAVNEDPYSYRMEIAGIGRYGLFGEINLIASDGNGSPTTRLRVDGAWNVGITGNLSVSGALGVWIALPFGSGWNNYAGYQACQYRKFGDRVHLRGLAQNSSTGYVIGTLPSGYRPAGGRILLNLLADPAGAAGVGGYRVDIDTAGNITVVGWTPASGDWVSLDCSFSIS
jgi:hypothetical protein